MRKMIVIAVREYQAAVRTKAFIISLLAVPIISGGMIGVQFFLKDKVDTKERRFAVLDYSGTIYDAVEEALRQRNATDIFEGEGQARKQTKPRFSVVRIDPATVDAERATYELSERVRDDDFMAFVIIGADVLSPGEDGQGGGVVRYHSNSPTYEDIQQWLRTPIGDRVRQLRLAAADLDPKIVEAATRRVPVQNLGLVTLDEEGRITKAEKTNRIANRLVPFALMMLMVMVIMVGAQPLMLSVLEEKTQRIAEVLLGSVPPFQLMLGKLVGMVGVSLTLATVYLVAAYIGIHQAGFGEFFPTSLVWWFVLFQALAVLMFGSLFAAVGAAVSDQKEAQNLLMPVMVLIMLPMAVWMNVVNEPNSTMALTLSLFPPATPMLMMIRQAVPPGIPVWQPLLGAGLMLLTTVVFVFAAGRIFRLGILMQGKGASFGTLLRWVWRG